MRSPAQDSRDFVYGVSLSEHQLATFTPIRAGQPDYRYEARIFFERHTRLRPHGDDRDQLIADVLAQFERYLQVLQSPEFQLLHAAPEHPTGSFDHRVGLDARMSSRRLRASPPSKRTVRFQEVAESGSMSDMGRFADRPLSTPFRP